MNDTTTAGDAQRTLIARWRDDAGGTCRSWFLWEERLKNFRSIRRGLEVVVAEIEQSRFGNVYKGSSLETVVTLEDAVPSVPARRADKAARPARGGQRGDALLFSAIAGNERTQRHPLLKLHPIDRHGLSPTEPCRHLPRPRAHKLSLAESRA